MGGHQLRITIIHLRKELDMRNFSIMAAALQREMQTLIALKSYI